jgi:uncharacterized membrane protein
MEKTVDVLMAEYRWSARLSAASLISFCASLAVIALVGGDTGRDGLEFLIGCLLGLTLISSFLAMLLSTFGVVRNRGRLADWGMFLIFIWFIPYLGIALYLGTSYLLQVLRTNREK